MDRVSKAERELVRKMQRQTNADRIRSMTDAELANRIVCHVSCSCCPLEQEDCKKHCYELWLEWLKQDVKHE